MGPFELDVTEKKGELKRTRERLRDLRALPHESFDGSRGRRRTEGYKERGEDPSHSPRARQPPISHQSKSFPFLSSLSPTSNPRLRMVSRIQILRVHFDAKGDSVARWRAWSIVLSIQSLTVPALLIFSDNSVGDANQSKHQCQTQSTSMSCCTVFSIVCSCTARWN